MTDPFAVDWMELLCREVLRERTGALVAEACAWAVGLSDQPHHERRHGRVVPSGLTVGARAETDRLLAGEEDGRIDLGDARPGSFRDALNALTADGALHADRFDAELLAPFVHETCLIAAERGRRTRPVDWAELAEDVGEEPGDLAAVVAAAGWETPLRIEAEHRVLAAIGAVPLIEVEAEGLPLSLVRAAEAATRAAVPEPATPDVDLAGSLFLAEAAVAATGAPLPVAPGSAERLAAELTSHGLEPDDVVAVLPYLAVQPETADSVRAILRAAGRG